MIHKQFVLFYIDKGVELCGSDSFCPIDGRFNLYNACAKAKCIADRRHLKDIDVKYFRICAGSMLNPTFKTGYICLE